MIKEINFRTFPLKRWTICWKISRTCGKKIIQSAKWSDLLTLCGRNLIKLWIVYFKYIEFFTLEKNRIKIELIYIVTGKWNNRHLYIREIMYFEGIYVIRNNFISADIFYLLKNIWLIIGSFFYLISDIVNRSLVMQNKIFYNFRFEIGLRDSSI